MGKLSLFRKLQYQELEKITLDGKIIDLGGSRKSGYHELFKGKHEYVVANISEHYGYDVLVDLEDKFPFPEGSYDHAIAINLIEHIYDYHNVFQETHRILKKKGRLVYTIPFMFHIHGCPYDYNRFTADALKKIAEQHHFKVVSLIGLGDGIFSVFYQMLPVPYALRPIFETFFVAIDKTLKMSRRYRKLSTEYPLGYVAVLEKE